MNNWPDWAKTVFVYSYGIGLVVTVICAGLIVFLQHRAKHEHRTLHHLWILHLVGVIAFLPVLYAAYVQTKENFFTPSKAEWNCAITVGFLGFWVDAFNAFGEERKMPWFLIILGLLEIGVGVGLAGTSPGPKKIEYSFENMLLLLGPVYVAREGFSVIRMGKKIWEQKRQGTAGHP